MNVGAKWDQGRAANCFDGIRLASASLLSVSNSQMAAFMKSRRIRAGLCHPRNKNAAPIAESRANSISKVVHYAI